jgi:DNA (cytosine-5)-methyltransferase 1
MGFPDSFQIPVSDTQAYRQFGNSVVVPVISAIAGVMTACMRGEKLPFANDAQLLMPEMIAPQPLRAAG